MSTLQTTNLKNPSSGSNNVVLNADGTTTIASPSNIIKSGTAVASTSGTAIDFTSIPSWVKRVTVMFSGLSTSGSSVIQIRLGTSGGVESTGYLGGIFGNGSSENATTGVAIGTAGESASTIRHGGVCITNITSNTWVTQGSVGRSEAAQGYALGFSKTLSGTLDRVRITTVSGTDTFDAGSINILYEG